MSGGTGRSLGRAGLVIGLGVVGNSIAPGVGGAIGAAAGGILSNQLFPPEGGPDSASIGPRLGDSQIQGSSYGKPIPLVFGTDRIAGNVIQSSAIIETEHTNSINTGGGKGGGGGAKSSQTTFTYSVTLAIYLGEGPLVGIKRIFADRQVIWDPLNPILDNPLIFKFYPGDESQLPDPDLEALVGIGNQPAYRGYAYVVFPDLPLDQFNNNIPNFTFEVVGQGAVTVPSVTLQNVTSPGGFTFDPEMRTIWVLENTVGGNDVVRVYRSDSTEELYTIDLGANKSSLGITYQPAYVLVRKSLSAGTEIVNEPARMYLGDNTNSASGNGKVTSVETHNFTRRQFIPGTGSAFFYPSRPVFDWRTVKLTGPNFSPARLHVLPDAVIGFPRYGGTDRIDVLPPIPWSSSARFINVKSYADGLWTIDSGQNIASWTPTGFQIWTSRPGASPPASTNDSSNRLDYDIDRQALFVSYSTDKTGPQTNTIMRVDPDDGSAIWEVDPFWGSETRTPIDVAVHPELGNWWVFNIGAGLQAFMTQLDPADGSVIQDLTLDFTGSLLGGQEMFLYPGTPFAFVKGNNEVRRFPLFTVPTGDPVSLQSIVDTVLDKVGIDSGLRNTADLASSMVTGYTVATAMSARLALEPLMRAFLFDAAESDLVLKFVRRGQTSALTIPEDDLAATFIGQEAGPPVQITRTNESELPNHIDIVYKDGDNDYNVGTQYDRRTVQASSDISQIQVPVVISAEYAKRLAQVFLQNTWRERDLLTFSLGTKYVALDPTDVVTIPLPNGKSVDVRIVRTAYTTPGLIEFQGISRRSVHLYSNWDRSGNVSGPSIS